MLHDSLDMLLIEAPMIAARVIHALAAARSAQGSNPG
jgi:hypothetical protein